MASGSRARPRPGRSLLSQPGARWDAYPSRRSAASEAPGPQRQPALSRRWRGIVTDGAVPHTEKTGRASPYPALALQWSGFYINRDWQHLSVPVPSLAATVLAECFFWAAVRVAWS